MSILDPILDDMRQEASDVMGAKLRRAQDAGIPYHYALAAINKTLVDMVCAGEWSLQTHVSEARLSPDPHEARRVSFETYREVVTRVNQMLTRTMRKENG